MRFLIPTTVAIIETSDNFHISRLLLLLKSMSGKNQNKPIEGITKLAKLDFLLRYPNCLKRVLEVNNNLLQQAELTENEMNTIESKMIRYKYGPWDGRYRRWIAIMISKGLAITYVEGRTVKVKLTEEGLNIANNLSNLSDFKLLDIRSQLIYKAVGSLTATKLMKYVYETFPEILSFKFGEEITI